MVSGDVSNLVEISTLNYETMFGLEMSLMFSTLQSSDEDGNSSKREPSRK